MTYMAPKRRVVVRKRHALAGLLDPLVPDTVGQAMDSECLATANAAAAPLDAKVTDLAKNWNPTGFYTSEDVRSIIGQTMQVVQQGQAAIDRAAAEPNASQDTVMRVTNDLSRAGARALDYLQAAQEADQRGVAAVNAAGLKRWVTDTLSAASSAVVAASVIACITPWWVGALAAFQAAFDAAWNIVRQVVGVVLKLGELAIKVPDALDDVMTILKWGLGIGGAVWLIHRANRSFGGKDLL